jgi:hypothetical protein
MYCTACHRADCPTLLPEHKFCKACGCPSGAHQASAPATKPWMARLEPLFFWRRWTRAAASPSPPPPPPPPPPPVTPTDRSVSPPAPPPPPPPGPRKALLSITVEAHPVVRPELRLAFASAAPALDLSQTSYGIHATLERNADASVDAVVHPGASVHAQTGGSKSWKTYPGGARIPLTPGAVLYDEQGKLTARIDGREP